MKNKDWGNTRNILYVDGVLDKAYLRYCALTKLFRLGKITETKAIEIADSITPRHPIDGRRVRPDYHWSMQQFIKNHQQSVRRGYVS